MDLYAIKDLESDLYVTGKTPYRLVEFGPSIKLYKSQAEAMRVIEEPLIFEFKDKNITRLQNDLAWDLLEKLNKTDRWHINCSKEEYQDAVNQFRKLKVVKLCLDEHEQK